jgi:hypothetical protein
MTFLMGRVFLTIFNKIRDVNKKFANLVFYSWLRSKQHIKKSELHDLLQGRMFILTGLDCSDKLLNEKRSNKMVCEYPIGG